MRPKLIVYPDKSTLAEAAAQRTLLTLLDDFGTEPDRERVDVLLTGGSDTIAALKYMADNPLIRAVDWQRVHLWWADERFVRSDDSARNALMAHHNLLNRLVQAGQLPQGNIHEMPADERSDKNPAQTQDQQHIDELLDDKAREYERQIVEALGDAPRFDLALLGMGPDGHYASLFPGHREIEVTDRIVVGVSDSPKPPPLRLTLTVPVLARTRRTWFLTAGEEKADALKQVFNNPNNPAYPASFADGTEEYYWFTDPGAAAQILKSDITVA